MPSSTSSAAPSSASHVQRFCSLVLELRSMEARGAANAGGDTAFAKTLSETDKMINVRND